MTTTLLLVLATLFLAYSNGANDNFKGVATLFGSGTADYKRALGWATITTFAGSVASIILAESLIKQFSGKGLVPDAIAGSPDLLFCVAGGAGITVILATRLGFPISTTHSLTGALLGGGLAAVGWDVNFGVLGKAFFLPLLLSPLVSLALGAAVYALFHFARLRLGVAKEWCVCLGQTETVIPIPQAAEALPLARFKLIEPRLGDVESCVQRYSGNLAGMVTCQQAVDALHYLSAGLVSFARGVNDTPKIVALLLTQRAMGVDSGMLAVALCMAAGGVLSARRVAETMSMKITPLNHGQGFSANLVTSLLVLWASRWGLPVSTTHVSVGSLFGIGLITGRADKRVVSGVILSWLMTLPLAAAISGSLYLLLLR